LGSNALDGRPVPVSPIGDHPECRLVVTCRHCRRRGDVSIAALLAGGLAPRTRIHQVADRLRCRACGGTGRVTGVEGWSRR
jgi:hypothetical protein